MNNAKIYLCKTDRTFLGCLTGLKTDTCNFTKKATDYWELTFEVERYIDNNGSLEQSSYYDSIDEMMKLYLECEDNQAYFIIDSEPVIKGDGYQETKTVTAHSIECELSDTYLKNLKINCGTSDSQEYLAVDNNGNFYNINPYTGLPYEYISLINYNDTQLSLLHLVLQNTGWTVKEGIDEEICDMKGSFDTSDSVYSFLMKTVSPAASVIFEFDRKHKTVGVVRAADYGKDTGVFITMRNLMNSFEVTSSSQDSIMTKLTPKGANDLGIEYVNFGKDYILNLDYFMNELNEYGDYKFVSRDLHDKYNIWKNYRETDTVTYNGNTYTRRELYRELTRQYNQSVLEISGLKNRVPNDGCLIDYTTYSLEDLKTSLTAYRKALASLITLYKNEYGVTALGNAPDYSPAPEGAVSIKNTPYWYDFYAYQESIIPQVEEALKMYCETDENGSLAVGENGDYIELDTGNTYYYADTSIVKTVDSYLYEWSLYGLDELEAKKKAWSEAANILYNECFILNGTASAPKKYRTADETGWNSLTSEQKTSFTSQSAYISQLNSYLDYMSFDERENSLTETTCKGIIRQCDDAIAERTNEIVGIEAVQAEIGAERSELAQSVLLETITIDGEKLFSSDDLAVITSLMRETDYTNENILITSLDDIVSEVDVQEELYQAAVEKLYEISQPQYSFSTELDNLFSLEEFKAYQKPFDVGNYIRVGLEIHEELNDNNYIKLRLISMTYNPLETSDSLSVEFSTMTKSLNGISDLAFLLDSEISSSRSSSSGSSSGSGTYGNNDANVQISNNMLNALLSTELFGTAVTDVILDSIQANKGDFNTLFSHSGVFDSLEAGQIKVSGDCLTDRIKSWNWNGTDSNLLNNTEGSIIDLSNGKFNFAGGKLKWDGETLSIKGNGEFTGTIYGTAGRFEGSINVNNNFIVDESGNVTANGTLKASNANITGIINAKNSIVSESQVSGDITADTLTATEGTIGGFRFDGNTFYEEDDERFVINNDGVYIKAQNFITDNIGTYSFNLPKNVYTSSIEDINIPLTVYFTGYEHFDEDQEFSLFIYANDINCSVWSYNLPDAVRISTYATYQYRFYKSDIQTGNSHIPDSFSYYIDTSKVGYVTLNNMEYVTNDLQYNIENDYGYPVTYVRVNAFNQFHSICTLSPNFADDNFDKWNINYEPIKMLYIYYACGTSGTSISGYETQYAALDDYTPISMLLGPNSLRFGTNSNLSTSISTNGFKSSYIYNKVSVTGSELYIGSDGTIGLSGSSERFKNSISTTLNDVSNPHGLYDIDVVQYKYNDDYFSSKSDSGIGKYFIGFIAEDVAEKFKDGATFDNQGLVSGWSMRYMFPAALKLVQEQHKDIEELKDEIEKLKQK